MPLYSDSVELRWSVGKFVYARGGTTLLHYMPLHEFHLEDGLNVSAIVSLRARRRAGGETGIGNIEVSRWIDLTQSETLASIAAILLDDGPARPVVMEYDPGYGLFLESLKLALAQRAPARSISYIGIGPERMWRRLSLLHCGEQPIPRFVARPEGGQADLVILSHATGLREPEGPGTAPETLIPQLCGRALMAVRVVEGSQPIRRTTVAGRQVQLPALSEILALCRAAGEWSFRYLRGHDSGYFLPEDKLETGLLLAYRTSAVLTIPRFRPVERWQPEN
jgi:hypothetical protein